jgi:putative hydrolase of the HAD superfamily
MKHRIEAVLFDMSGTLRKTTQRKDGEKISRVSEILKLLGCEANPQEFTQKLTNRKKAYKRWTEETLVELSEEEIWKQWMLPDFPAAQVSKLASQLNRMWHDAVGTYEVLPETREVITQLFRREYLLGLVSNTTNRQALQLLEQLGLAGCFESVILSCDFGRRKPHPAILLAAAKQIGIHPDQCAYIGNRPEKDVAAARNAGFGMAILLCDPNKPLAPIDNLDFVPDHFINNLKELLEIFPPRQVQATNLPTSGSKKFNPDKTPVWDASLSSMWGVKNFPGMSDFILASQRLGFARIELNHQVTSNMFAGFNWNGYQVSTVHEPCPADVSVETLKARDWLISAINEENRRKGVAAVKKSIDLAKELTANVVVVHSGLVQDNHPLENDLRTLYKTGKQALPEFLDMKQRVVDARAALVGPRLEAVIKSLAELLDYSRVVGVQLALENRYHYMDIPSLDEMGILLDFADSEQLGFVYDVGHAQALDRLGFFPHEEWLKRYAKRMFVAHIHDVIGINDHHAPGLGEVNFAVVAAYLPLQAIRTLEVSPRNTSAQVKAGMQLLVETGCVRRL